jgi:mannose-1-phosphate guanylyltransferase/phosphomannomutase
MKAVIIAGGPGTRLRPLTYNLPKPIISFFDKPFLVYQLEYLKKYDINEIIINTHYLHTKVKDILKDGSDFGVKIFYSYEEKPMGTAGAVKLAENYFDDDPVLVLNGDILTNIDISEIINYHKKNNSDITIALTKVKDPTSYGLVFTDENGRIEKFLEKPSYDEAVVNTINAGIYIINPEYLKLIPKNEPYSFERGLFPLMLNLEKNLYAYISNSYWIDIGTTDKYIQAHHDTLIGKININIPYINKEKNVFIGKDVDIDESVSLEGPLFIGDRVKIRKYSFIEEFSIICNNSFIDSKNQVYKSIILSNTKIQENCNISHSIIGNNCLIEENSKISKNVVIADNSIIRKGSTI